MTITPLLPARIHSTKRRIRDLEALRLRVDDEIARLRDELARETTDREEREAARRKRGEKPPCGTEESYQWHRHHERDTNWPLPKDDPCGCKAAHNKRERERELRKRLRRRGEVA